MRILFVSGFSSNTRARELAYEFERFGPLVRCDVPAPRNSHSRAVPIEKDCGRNPFLDETDVLFAPDNLRDASILEICIAPFSSCVQIRALLPTRRLFLKSQPSINGNSTKSVFNSYAFVEFRDGRDAENAYHDMHGRNFDGHRLSIQWARKPPSAGWRVADGSAPPPRSDRDSRARSRSPRRRSPERRRDRDPEPRRRHSSRGRNRDEARTPPPPPYATPMAAGDDHESDRRDTKEYKDSKDSEGDRRGSIRDRRGGSRDRRDRDVDDREARFRREDAGATLED